MALNSLKLLDDCDIVAAHIFPFSPRPDTPAARMPQVEREMVKARAARLREAAAERRTRWLDGLVGTTQPVLVEGDGTGHTDNFAPVAIAGATRGETGTARVTGRDGDQLDGGLGMSWLDRLRGGFSKTAERVADNLTGLASRAALDTSTLDDIEEALIASDLGPEASHRIREAIAAPEVRAAGRARASHHPCRGDREDPRAGRQAAGGMGLPAPARHPRHRRQRLGQDHHDRQARPLAEGTGLRRPARRRRHLPRRRDRAAADLGRAHRRAGHLGQGRRRRGRNRVRRRQAGDRDRQDVLIVDTAGRLQNKSHLMEELSKIRRVLGRLNPEAPHDVLLVLDATTGQNALAQVEVFRESAGVTGLIMTKLDGTARGGILVAAAEKFGLPIHAIGVGEKGRRPAPVRPARRRPRHCRTAARMSANPSRRAAPSC